MTVTYRMNRNVIIAYKKVLIDTLKAFDQFCDNNNLNYYACSGTAIGTVRHKGFIPWDDDIDVYMLRQDYDRLINLRDRLSNTHYRIANLGDEGYIYSYAKFYDYHTTLQEFSSYPSCCIGIYIDIFPLDEVSSDIDYVREKKKRYESLFRDFQDTYFKPNTRWFLSCLYHLNFKRMIRTLYCCNLSLEKKKLIRQLFIDYEKDWIKEKGPYLYYHHATYSLEKELYKKDWFQSYLYMPFENYKIRMSVDYDKYLTHLFGDYMTLPPHKNQIPHHSHYYLNMLERLDTEQVKERIEQGESLVF